MNPDLLKKLVKLANNNPNENEANLAARKVCKMIEEAKFQFNGNNSIPPSSQSGIRYSDVERTTEPQWKSTPPKANDFRGAEGFWKAYEDMLRRGKYKVTSYDSESYNQYYQKGPSASGTEQRKKERIDRICVECKRIVHTANINNVFVCNECQWTAYEKKQNDSQMNNTDKK